MHIKRATVEDVPRISALICSLSTLYILSPDTEGAEPYLESINEPAIRGYIIANNFRYLVAESEGQLIGVIALRDNTHIYHMFIAEAFQGKGIGRELWETVKAEAMEAGNVGRFTVNSSLNAVPVYERLGFVPVGQRVEENGVTFQPMLLIEDK
jgi:GNAT superfamily N-acetyltransferase